MKTQVETKKDTYVRIKAFVEKNKTAPPFREAYFTINFERGFSPFEDTAEMAIAQGIVERKGSFYCFGEEKFRGKTALIEAMASDPALYDAILKEVQNASGHPKPEDESQP